MIYVTESEWYSYSKDEQLAMFEYSNIVVVRENGGASFPVKDWRDPALADFVDIDSDYQAQGIETHNTMCTIHSCATQIKRWRP